MSGSRGSLERFANQLWYGGNPLRFLLWPISLLYGLVSAIRRMLYRSGALRSFGAGVPVVIVGNVTVGGTGKTPVTLWLAGRTRELGLKPAIVARGYGASGIDQTLRVTSDSDPQLSGDEPVLLARRSGCPVYVDRNRVRAARTAAADGASIVICDDGLQHYRLRRDAEIAVVDGVRGFGNGYLLPAGPLREPLRRLSTVDRIMVQVPDGQDLPGGGPWARGMSNVTRFSLRGDTLLSVAGEGRKALASLRGQSVQAIAGIADPVRFFAQLERAGLRVTGTALPDHARIVRSDIDLEGDVIMTEKDAVKCRQIADRRHWYLPVDLAVAEDAPADWLADLLGTVMSKGGVAE